MAQPKSIDNPEYADHIRKILQREAKNRQTCTADLMKDKGDLVERKNISRKMKKLERLNLVQKAIWRRPTNRKVHENFYAIDYDGFAALFSRFLYKKYNFVVMGSRWNLTARRFSKKEGEPFKRYIKHYLNDPRVQEKDTIRQMFYEMMMVSYAYAMQTKKSNGFDKINAIIRDSMAAERFYQMRRKVPIKVTVFIKGQT